MVKREYRDLAEKKLNSIVENARIDIENLINDDVIDGIESSVNEVKNLLTDVQEMDIKYFEDIKTRVHDAIELLDELADKLY